MVQNDKNICPLCLIPQEACIIWLQFMVHRCKTIHFHFFRILIFRVVWRVKGQKTVQNIKKICLSCSIFQEAYTTWLSFMVHMCKIMISPCKIMISPCIFSFFQNFDFSGCKQGFIQIILMSGTQHKKLNLDKILF